MELKPGKSTSERNGTLLTHLINTVIAVSSLLVYIVGERMPDWLLGILIGLPSLLSTVVQANYNSGRAAVKIASTPTSTTPPQA